MEEWKSIKDFDRYLISSNGRVKSLITNKILKQIFDKSTGYLNVKLRRNNKYYTKHVHRLVVENFVPNLENKPLTDHINANKIDNRLVNLRWCTQKENMEYARQKGLTNFGRKKILCIELNKSFISSRQAATWLNNYKFNNTKNIESIAKFIRAVCRKDKWKKTAYGFHWINK